AFRDLDADVLEVVHARALHADQIVAVGDGQRTRLYVGPRGRAHRVSICQGPPPSAPGRARRCCAAAGLLVTSGSWHVADAPSVAGLQLLHTRSTRFSRRDGEALDVARVVGEDVDPVGR